MREVVDNSVSGFTLDGLWEQKKGAEKTEAGQPSSKETEKLEADPVFTNGAADESVVVPAKGVGAQRKLFQRRRIWWKIKPVLTALLCLVVFCALAVVMTAVVNQMSVFQSAGFWAGKLISQWNMITGQA